MADFDAWIERYGPPIARTDRPGVVKVDGTTITVADDGTLTSHGGGSGGGLAVPSGQSGGVPFYNTANTLASSAALAVNAIVLGGGAGSSPITLGGFGTAGQVLTSAGSGAAPTWTTPASGSGGSGTVTSIATGAGLTGGPISVSGTISLANIASGNLLANVSGSAAAPAATSLSGVLDAVLGSSQGSIVYRGAGGWAALGAGTNGNVLQTQGPGASPIWAAVSGGSGTVTLTGDISGSGTGSIVTTLPTVNGTVGTYPKVTVNAKGQVTAGFALAPADLPVATTAAFGAVKPDGTTITIASGVISAVGGSGGLPAVNANQVLAGPVSGGAATAAGRALISADLPANPVLQGTGSVTVPVGTTGQQPGSPTNGMLRFNSTTSRYEWYIGAAWINHIRLTGETGAVDLSGAASVAVPTLAPGTNTTGAASSAFVQAAIAAIPSSTLYRSVAGTTDTPTLADDLGTVEFTSSSATTVTVNYLAAGKSYVVRRTGAGTVTLAAGAGVTLTSDQTSPSYAVKNRYGTLTVFCTGTANTVSVNGAMT